jgi:transposase-like protein
MKTKKQEKFYVQERRIFSEEIRRQTVRDIELRKCTVRQASNEFGISDQAIYKWLYKYSRYLVKKQQMVVEHESEAYRSKELEKRLKELESIIGRKQMEIDLLNKVIDLANDEYKTDLKKNLSKNRSNGSKGTKG